MDTDPQNLLRERILQLEAENARLRDRIDFLEGVPTLRAGMRGESLVAQLVNGRLTTHTAPHDVVVTNGIKLEVKYSRLSTPNLRFPNSKRWNWGHPLGVRGGKDFDRILLIGESDPRYLQAYKDVGSPYVIFDVPYSDAVAINRKDHMIQITTDPSRAGSGTRRLLFGEFQTTLAELKDRYRVITTPRSA